MSLILPVQCTVYIPKIGMEQHHQARLMTLDDAHNIIKPSIYRNIITTETRRLVKLINYILRDGIENNESYSLYIRKPLMLSQSHCLTVSQSLLFTCPSQLKSPKATNLSIENKNAFKNFCI